jgi:hypothetical protein
MGYNSSTLRDSGLEMNSYFTQVAHLLFEYLYELTKYNKWRIFMLYQSLLNLGISYVGNSHKRQNSVITILSNKCSNNYPWIVYVLHLVIGLGKEALSYSINSFVNWMIPCKAKVDLTWINGYRYRLGIGDVWNMALRFLMSK